MQRTWVITGASSGFGLELAKLALDAGDNVVAVARREAPLRELGEQAHDRVVVSPADITVAQDRDRIVRDAVERFGAIDVLVNNAGRTQVGAVEETSENELRSLFELHFFAPAALTRAVLPHMRAGGGGWIVQMSSVGGQVTAPGFSAYCATKFALEGFTETLRDEVGEFGIRVLIVEPGAFRTGLFNPGAAYFSEPMAEYAASVAPTREYVRTGGGSQPGDPAKAARAILTAIESEQPPLRLVLGTDAIENVRKRLGVLAQELDDWQAVGAATRLES
jgi:NAD(P)-dependent dehydrogenase (short-subunit alcohol dehydrogenase family)